MEKFIIILFIIFSWESFSQVGIGTTTPEASLDIRSSNQTAPLNTDGLLIPKIDVFPTVNPTAQQQGMMVYLNTTVGSNLPGFYYWDNPTTTWIPFTSAFNGYWSRDTSGYLFPNIPNDRVEIENNTDATGVPGTGAFEIANSLRIDENEIVTNTNSELFLQNGNNGDLSVDNNSLFVDASTNRVGVRTILPTANLHVNGNVRIVDGTQATGRVLTSSANGTASWRAQSIDNITGNVVGNGVNIPYTTTNYLQTGSRIVLPPGRFAVNVTMLIYPSNPPSPNDSSFWLRTTFSDNGGANPSPSAYIEGSPLISGSLSGSSNYGLVTGTIIINNTTGANRTYYYVAGNTEIVNTADSIIFFGGTTWDEDTIIAYRLN
ncbi:hypothetical protein POV26_01835 [Aequorivita todarodis]|uniref:hypothetical protein n=1 Tax=Aequorivita todarodis TaxID=2036821 RepID=UPI00235010C7|nr:hypothetical protein [Aequorivita todarodis]MDC7999765.1 hypothetical protein [Aequorivita todarodis]